MDKKLLNEQIRFQAIAGLRPIGSLGTAYSLNEDDADSDYVDTNAPEISESTLTSLFPGVDKGDMDNYFFMDLFKALRQHFMQNAKTMPNVDAKAIAHHLSQAASALEGRSGN